MTSYVALLRAVNVGGTSTLPMTALVRLCATAGFARARTYIASGNAMFDADGDEPAVRTALAAQLEAFAGRRIEVIVRTAAEIADVAARNPFPDAPGNRVMALFTDAALPVDPLAGAAGVRNERAVAGRREIYLLYPDGVGSSRLRMPIEKLGTMRNMNTIAKLATAARKA